MKSLAVKFTALLTAALMLSGCSNDDDNNPVNPPSNVTAFVGTVNGTDGILSGAVTFSITGTAVTGTFKIVTPSASTHTLTGSYDNTSKVLTATGDGYSFGGVYDDVNRLEGVLSGNATGLFVTLRDENNSLLAFCGTFSGDDDGIWNFTIDGNIIAGSYTTTNGNVGALDGTISGNNITIDNPTTTAPLAVGTRSGDNASGTWDNGQGNTGSWIGYKSN